MTPFDDLDIGCCPDYGTELEYTQDDVEDEFLYCPGCDRHFEEWEI